MFGYHPLAINDYRFLTSVDRVTFNKFTALVAQPLRALMDLVALRKVQWAGMDWLTSGMRIGEDALFALKRKDFAALRSVYKHTQGAHSGACLVGMVNPAREGEGAVVHEGMREHLRLRPFCFPWVMRFGVTFAYLKQEKVTPRA